MKYIRTKDGRIVDTNNLYICEELNGKPYGIKDSGQLIYKENIIKEADNIEDLFDGILVVNHSAPFEWLKYGFANYISDTIMKGVKNHHCEVKGFIETDKGLIYVAKMNDKGEWELL